MQKQINIYQAKTNFSKLIQEVISKRSSITIYLRGTPVAELVPFKKKKNLFKEDRELKGAKYLQDPCAGVDAKDWPEEFR
jgi:prevent-host-death family protein